MSLARKSQSFDLIDIYEILVIHCCLAAFCFTARSFAPKYQYTGCDIDIILFAQ
jgi:hypothetical protein